MKLKKREEVCNDIIELARLARDIPAKTWDNYPEEERKKAEDNLVYARNFLRAIFEEG